MSMQDLLFNPQGRIGARDYWTGVLIIVVGNIVAGLLPLIGGLIWLGLIWVGICVYGKRLHDMGRTAWLHAVPWLFGLVLLFVGMVLVGGAIITTMLTDSADTTPWAVLSAGGGVLGLLGLQQLIWIGYTLWVGFSEADPGANAYGPAPVIEATIIDE